MRNLDFAGFDKELMKFLEQIVSHYDVTSIKDSIIQPVTFPYYTLIRLLCTNKVNWDNQSLI